MYYMEKLSKEETFDRTLKKEDVLKFRAQVVKRLTIGTVGTQYIISSGFTKFNINVSSIVFE